MIGGFWEAEAADRTPLEGACRSTVSARPNPEPQASSSRATATSLMLLRSIISPIGISDLETIMLALSEGVIGTRVRSETLNGQASGSSPTEHPVDRIASRNGIRAASFEIQVSMSRRIDRPGQDCHAVRQGQNRLLGVGIRSGAPRTIDPLMGYTTSGDMKSQIRLTFETRDGRSRMRTGTASNFACRSRRKQSAARFPMRTTSDMTVKCLGRIDA